MKAHEVAFTHCTHETRCPLHDNGPVWEVQLIGVVIELANIQLKDARRPVLLKKKRDLEADIAVYKLHLAQYEVQRKHIAKVMHHRPQGGGMRSVSGFREYVQRLERPRH